MNRYGLPYQGSKSRLAERIVELLPAAGCLVDAMAGGCAVTHCALLSGKWGRVWANDIGDSALFFGDVARGRYRGRDEWVGREDFLRLRDADPWVRLVYSFSNDQRTYLYGPEVEGFKRMAHAMLTAGSARERRLAMRAVMRQAEGLMAEGRGRVALDMEVLERLEALERIEGLDVGRLVASQGDYRGVAPGRDAVIYCDIPYRGTRGYRGLEFDYEAFYEWALGQEVPVFVSEYWMPEDRFVCVAEMERRCSFSATNNGLRKVERIFRPINQI